MSGKNKSGFGTGRLQAGWSVLNPQPDAFVWAAWYLCSGNGARQASFLSLPSSYPPRAEAESSPLSTYSHMLFKLAPALATYPPDLVPAGQPPGVIPTKVARSDVYVYRICWAWLRLHPGLVSPYPQSCVRLSPVSGT